MIQTLLDKIKTSRFFGLLLLSVCLSNPGYSQKFEWLKTFGTQAGFDRIQRVSAEPNGGCSFLFAYVTKGTSPDTLKLGSYKYIKNPLYASANFLVRLDSGGNIIKVRLISLGKDLNNMCRDDKGNFYLAGQIASSGVFDGVTLTAAKGNMVYAKYDSDLNRIWLLQTGYSATPHDLFFSQGHLLFTCRAPNGTTTIGPRTFNFTYTNFVYGEINPTSGTIKWCNYLYKSSGFSDYIHLTGIQYLKGNFFISGISSKDVNLDSGYFFKGGFIAKTDTLGKYKQSIYLQNNKFAGFSCITSDGEFLYASGNDLDSFSLDGKKVYSPNGALTVASFTSGLKLRWVYQPKIIDKSKLTGGPVVATNNEGYIYFGGTLKTKIEMAGGVITPAGIQDVFFFKMDYLGNVLWAANGSTQGEMFGLDAIAGRYVYAGGYFEKKISFGTHTDTSKGETDGWLTRILDNSIVRGTIKKGPYCAGDTIKIPYKKFGEFDTSNYFIAELSDENGNFETGIRELGRIKSNKEGIVIGKLPLLNVSSSSKYSVRVRSTYPALQSYFRLDTLNLLIYSRDKANPGPPETICMGDSLKLNTYGGSKWTWSPKYNMDNSAKRQPLVWPTRDTVYRIIISDSFGCGKPDTAFKKVFVRSFPKSLLNFTDTIICNNSLIKIPVRFTGGDSAYQWQWLSTPPANQWLLLGKGKSKINDTLIYRPSAKITHIERVAIVLTDGCTSKPDTAYVKVSYRTPVIIKTEFRDTFICSGQKTNYKVSVTGGVTKYLRYQWYNLTTNTLLSINDSLSFNAGNTTKIRLVVNDGCINLGDSAWFTVAMNPGLKAITTLKDTSLCYGGDLKYYATGKGGDSASYSFTWLLDNKVISNTNNLILKTKDHFPGSGATSTLSLILKDNCSLPNDTIKKTIILKPGPKADFSYDAACSKTPVQFSFTGTKPLSPIITSFNWNLNNEATSTLENPSRLFSSPGTKTLALTIISNNGCTDTLTKTIEVKPQSLADFTTNDVCETDSAVFINKSKDATGYNWKFGDGRNSKLPNPKKLYNIGGITQTFNVTLVAIVTNGCSDSISKQISINANPISDFTHTISGTKLDLKAKAGSIKYQWIFGTTDSLATSNSIYTHTIKSNDQYNVCLKVSNLAGCISKTCKNVTAGTRNFEKSSGFKIYPVPNSGNFTIEIYEPSNNLSITVYDYLGNVVKTNEISPSKNLYNINLEVANGVYLVKVINGESSFTQKVTIVK